LHAAAFAVRCKSRQVLYTQVSAESGKVWEKIWSICSLEKSGEKIFGVSMEEEKNFPDLTF